MRKRYVLKNKRRFLIIVMILISIISSIFIFTTKSIESKEFPLEYQDLAILKGDTLWDIAKEITDETEDIRKVIRHIKKINNMETSEIFTGQVIKIPIR